MANESLDAAIHAAHAATPMEPKRVVGKPAVKKPVAASKVPAKVGAPTVKVDKSSHRVRLRNIDHALEGCISMENKEIRYRLEPNKWTDVPEEVYISLRDKFYKPQEYTAPDWDVRGGSAERVVRKEEYQEYIIEFPEEA